MKIKCVKTDKPYLTEGKVYDGIPDERECVWITDNEEIRILIYLPDSSHGVFEIII